MIPKRLDTFHALPKRWDFGKGISLFIPLFSLIVHSRSFSSKFPPLFISHLSTLLFLYTVRFTSPPIAFPAGWSEPTMDLPNPDLNALIRKTQALSLDDISTQLEVDPTKAEQKAFISLVARLASKKILFKPVVHEAIRSTWNFASNMKIKDAGPNTFLIHFESPSHKERVLLQAPWNVKGFLLILREWSPAVSISAMDFSRSAFWVQIHGFPMKWLSSRNAKLIGDNLGVVLEVDSSVDQPNDCSDFMRVKVELDVSEPLSPGFYFHPTVDLDLWISFKYERLSWFCYNCGRLDHLLNQCDAAQPHPLQQKLGSPMRAYPPSQAETPPDQLLSSPSAPSRALLLAPSHLLSPEVGSPPPEVGPSKNHLGSSSATGWVFKPGSYGLDFNVSLSSGRLNPSASLGSTQVVLLSRSSQDLVTAHHSPEVDISLPAVDLDEIENFTPTLPQPAPFPQVTPNSPDSSTSTLSLSPSSKTLWLEEVVSKEKELTAHLVRKASPKRPRDSEPQQGGWVSPKLSKEVVKSEAKYPTYPKRISGAFRQRKLRIAGCPYGRDGVIGVGKEKAKALETGLNLLSPQDP